MGPEGRRLEELAVRLARPLAERSVGTPDPGAVSLAMIAESIHRTIFG